MTVAVIFLGVVVAISLADPLADCPVFPPRPTPTSIKDLRPQDVSVIMALGDSITAGFAMLAEGFDVRGTLEFRGLEAFMGGDETATSIPNFLRHYTNDSKLIGPATGNSTIIDADIIFHHSILPNNPEICHLNAAQSNAIAQDLPGQVKWLNEQMPLQGVDVDNDWKVMTILIGANNLCPICETPMPSFSVPDAFVSSLNETIANIYATIPRVFVNLLPLFNISQVYDLQYLPHCKVFWDLIGECHCMSDSDATRKYMDDMTAVYNNAIFQLVSEWSKVDSDDFALILQPFSYQLQIPNESYMSKFDCFHPNGLANYNMAIALWNNMILPSANKQWGLVPGTQPLCAQQDTLLYTY